MPNSLDPREIAVIASAAVPYCALVVEFILGIKKKYRIFLTIGKMQIGNAL
jgi:hypothetical protein